MPQPVDEWIDKAMSLTRAGKLTEATAAIQRALGRIGLPLPLPLPGRATRRTEPRRPAAAKAATEPVRRPTPTPATPATPVTPIPPATSTARPTASADRKSAFIDGTYTAYGLRRDYKLYVPAVLDASPGLVVMLHGCTQSPDDFAAGTRMNEWAERQGIVVLYPAQSHNANPSGCWNWYQSSDQRRDAGEVGLIASLTRQIVADFGLDPSRVYAAGLSAGGAMAANLAAAYPDLYAAIGVHSGLVAGAASNVVDALGAMRDGARASKLEASRRASRPVPTIVFHGDRDSTVHPENGAQVVLAALGGAGDALPDGVVHEVDHRASAAGHQVVRHSYLDAAGAVQVEHWVLRDAGHAWSGGDKRGTHTDPKGIDATAELLRFFAAHRLVPAAVA